MKWCTPIELRCLRDEPVLDREAGAMPSSVAPNTARPPGAHFVSTRRMSSNCGREPVYPLVYPWDRWKTKRVSSLRANPLILLAEWTGLEPATPGVTGRYSNQLNYHSAWRQRFRRHLRKPCQTWRPLGDSNPCSHRERVVS